MKLNDYEIKHNEYLKQNGAECTVLLKKDGKFPLEKAGDIALYGNGARNTIKGGTGSGEVNSRFFVTVEDGLKGAGFNITSGAWLDAYDKIVAQANKQFVKDIYKEAKEKHARAYEICMGRVMAEPEYELPIDAKADTAVYVLSRISGEGSDREAIKGDILLSDTEVRDILACNEKYEKFILVINAGGVVDLTPVCQIKNILVLSQLGVETGDILANILLGISTPSGKLATTWSAVEDYSTIGDFGERDDTRYKEGIYVGYRFFDSIGRKAKYPFGFGLSYTEFDITDEDFSIDGRIVSITSNVKNTGNHPGKEVVQVYVSVPSGRLDQPYQMLAGFAKTRELKPGESQKVSITFDPISLASYDEVNEAYILESGDYVIRVGNSSLNTRACGIVHIDEEICTAKVKNVLGKPDFEDFVPENVINNEADDTVKSITLDAGLFETFKPDYDASVRLDGGNAGSSIYDIDPVIETLTEEQLIKMNIGAFDPKGGIVSMIGNSGFTVAGAAGQSYMHATDKGIPTMAMADGPAGVRISRQYAVDKEGKPHVLGSTLPETMVAFMPWYFRAFMKMIGYKVKKTDLIKEQCATAIPIGTAIAQSFNLEFAQKCGDIVGFEMAMFGVQLWLAPALNIHRDIRCGRNFEYYSEDPLVSGLMTAAITKGVQSHPGCGVTIKHYAANNQEYNRTQNNSAVSERALREIYLKGFGIAVKESAPKAVMTSYNLINGIHTASHRGLIEDILRAEYEYQGIVMTDWNVGNMNAVKNCKYPLPDAPSTVMAGGDLYMPGGQHDYLAVKKALVNGTVTKKQLQINATRVMRMAQSLVQSKS